LYTDPEAASRDRSGFDQVTMPLFSKSRIMDLGLPREEAIRRLARVTNFCHEKLRTVTADQYCRECGRGPIRFGGKITKAGFHIKPIPRWTALGRRSATPVITGDIQASAGGSRVSISMRDETPALIFGLVVPCALCLCSLFLLKIMLSAGQFWPSDPGELVGRMLVVLLPSFGAAVVFVSLRVSFALEANWVYRLLEHLWSLPPRPRRWWEVSAADEWPSLFDPSDER
jgi:hypothetical protein